jgi:lipid-A-disaccharide synthase
MKDLNPYLKKYKHLQIQVVQDHNYDVMQVCDAIIAVSGTATLEIAIIGTPLVIIYKASWFEYFIAKSIIKIPYIGLCNILMNKSIVKELIQYDATPEKITMEIENILYNQGYRNEMIKNLHKTKELLYNHNQNNNIAELVLAHKKA